jgi:alkylation response protein AidB-like acyl-CoA dehydrogenase
MSSSSLIPIESKKDLSSQLTPFPEFLGIFKTKLNAVFSEHAALKPICDQRGLQSMMMNEIMSCTPLSVAIPTSFGGRGGIMQENLEVLAAASYESLALSLTLGINSALFLQPVSKYGQESVKESVFRRFINDKSMGGLMITEPGFGSDALGMQTNFTIQDNRYHISGEKHWGGLTGFADFWLITARSLCEDGNLMRDIDFFICDARQPDQKIVVEEYFENLGLYMIPYGRNRIDIHVPRSSRLEPKTTGVHMMLDLLHRSRVLFPGMGLGFIKRMLDEAIRHCNSRLVGKKSLSTYDQVQQRLARLQANFTICSAFCGISSKLADLKNDLMPYGIEANIIKSVTSDLMQESSQSLLQLVGAKGYRLDQIAGQAVVDSRPFQIFEGSNDILYAQISESVIKLMKSIKETNFLQFLKGFNLTTKASEYFKEFLNFDIRDQPTQRKSVELGNLISRIVSMEYVIQLGESGFRTDLIKGAITMLQQEIRTMLTAYSFNNAVLVVQGYEENSSWHK